MNNIELILFAEQIKELRDGQKVYYQTRSPAMLVICKARERAVDNKVQRILDKRDNDLD